MSNYMGAYYMDIDLLDESDIYTGNDETAPNTFNRNGDDCLLYRYRDDGPDDCPFYSTKYCREECPWNEAEII